MPAARRRVVSASVLVDALAKQERTYRTAIDRLRDMAPENAETEAEVTRLVWALREAVELVGCLRRLLPAQTVGDIHRAFGAPGDFGYDTPIGDALANIYLTAGART
jgi:hypothetical protein